VAAVAADKSREIQRMWNAGAAVDEIAARVGLTKDTVAVRISVLRRQGYDLVRRTTLAGARCPQCHRAVAEDGRLCAHCAERQRARDRRRQAIAGLVQAGNTNREIAASVGMGLEALRKELRQMRVAGYVLPPRSRGGPLPDQPRPEYAPAEGRAIEWRGELILELAWRGASDTEIAAELEVGESSVWQYMNALRQAGHEFPPVVGRRRRWRDIERSHEEIAALVREGLAADEVAARLGRTTESVCYQLGIMRDTGYDVAPEPGDRTSRKEGPAP
jgi:transposase